jgi:hypothetical protein
MKAYVSLVLISLSLALAGCSTPFKQTSSSARINQSTASRVTVQSVSTSSFKKILGNDYSPAEVSINGELMGEFSRNETSFSYEVNPGSIRMDFCLSGYMPPCLVYNANIEPNKHYYFEYELEGRYMVIASGIQRKVRLAKVIPYGNPLIQSPAQIPPQTPVDKNSQVKPPSQNSGSSNQAGLEAAKKKCIDLGFKVGTESFGNCVLKVAN